MAFYNHIHCKYTGVKGFVKLYEYGLKWRYMITEKAKYKIRILIFWEKHGLAAVLDAFPYKRSTLFLWKKKFNESNRKIESLNEQNKTPKTKRKRLWTFEIIKEIQRLREEHPNLGKDKIYPLLKMFCGEKALKYPCSKTIGRLIKDLGGLRIFPQKISHFGKIKKVNRQKVLRKPKDFKAEYPGHCVALDTIERFVHGCRRYIITFEDLYTRFSFAWATKSHASLAAKEFFALCQKVFPFPCEFQCILTDNGSEFKKHFSQELNKQYLTHYHTYPKTPKMNAHLERFNRTIQEEFVDYNSFLLLNPENFNRKLVDYLIFYNTERVHFAFQNKLSPVQFMISFKQEQIQQKFNFNNLVLKSKTWWPHTILR